MTLQELKKMIAEEYSAYKRSIKEQDMDMPMGPPMPGAPDDLPGVAVSDADVDAMGGEDKDAEKTLKDIFNKLKDYFEGEDKPEKDPASDDKGKGDDKDSKPANKGGEGEDKKDDKEEVEENTSGINSGYKKVNEVKRQVNKARVIKESRRLQKLANIIK